jgi:hypothetical protein
VYYIYHNEYDFYSFYGECICNFRSILACPMKRSTKAQKTLRPDKVLGPVGTGKTVNVELPAQLKGNPF